MRLGVMTTLIVVVGCNGLAMCEGRPLVATSRHCRGRGGTSVGPKRACRKP